MIKLVWLCILFVTLSTAASAQVNLGHGGAWFNPETAGQGILVEVLPNQREVFVAWFTYADAEQAKVGAVDQRWFTAQGPIIGNVATLAVSRSTGGQFDQAGGVETAPYGVATLQFESCDSARFTYVLGDARAGSFDLARIAPSQFCDEQSDLAQAVSLPTEIASTETTAFVDVAIIPMDDSADVLGRLTVIVRNGKIETIGPFSAIEIPENAQIVHAPNAFLIPGLVDAHTHMTTNMSEYLNFLPPVNALDQMADNQLRLYLANGVTTIFNLGDFGEPLTRWSEEIIAGERIGPTIYAAQYARGGPGTGDGGPAGRFISGPADARSFTRAADAAGFEMMKIYNWTPADATDALVEQSRQLGLPIAGHIPQTVNGRSFLESGNLDLVAHLEVYTWSIFGWGQRANDIPPAVTSAVTGNVAQVTTLAIVETIADIWCRDQSGRDRFWALPETAYMSPSEVGLHNESMTTTRFAPPGCIQGAYDPQVPYMGQLAKALHAEGVPLILGTDSPTVFGAAGFSAIRELEALDRAGFSAAEILEIATRNGGDFIRERYSEDQRFGRIAPGYRADLILIDGNPLEDVARIGSDRLGVMARGHWRSSELLDSMADEVRSQYVQ